MNKKIPEIRFKGFNDEWISNNLGDMIDISSASRVHKDEWTSEGIPFFRSSDVISKYMRKYNTPAFISDTLYQELSKKSGKMKVGDLLVTGGGTIGVPYLIENEDPLYFKDADLIWLKNAGVIDGRFLYNFYISPQTRRYISSITHIGTISHYTIEQGKNTPISFPVKSEQEKIGTFFKQLDVTIALQQQLVEQQQQYKKAMIQKMFPQKGERVPKVRFDGFSGDWVNEKLSCFFKKYQEIIYLNDNKEYSQISIRNNGLVEFRGIKKGIDIGRKRQYLVNTKDYPNTLTFTRQTIYEGGIGFIPEVLNGSIVTENMPLLSMNQNLNSNFILSLFKTQLYYQNVIEKNMPIGSAQKALHEKVWLESELLFPSLEEQQKIGAFFKQLDDTIALHQKKLEDYQQLKKSLLQRMFV
ncbi:restriction endonuclease subunit S [Bacillus thuringiensis]|nr:restriction endonuclease subunit S [Bacillus thuringiensis]